MTDPMSLVPRNFDRSSFVVGASFFLWACSSKEEDVSAISLEKYQPDCFVADEANPILSRNEPFLGATWNDPSVISVDGVYYLYASSDHDENEDGILDQNIKIYRWKSEDGSTWTLDPTEPVLSPSTADQAFDRKGEETPSVVYFEGQYHLFYTGYPVDPLNPLEYEIGHATSSDGVNFTRRESSILAPSGEADFMQFITSEPGVEVVNDMIYLYFTAVGIDTDIALGNVLQVIGLMKSSDGINWSAPKPVLIPDQTLYPRYVGGEGPSAPGWYGFTTPQPVLIEDEVRLFFSVVFDSSEAGDGSGWNMRRIHHASSSDGESNWAQDSAAIFSLESFEWSKREIRSPAAVLKGTDLYLYFGGDDFFGSGSFGIGRAACSLQRDE